MRGFVEFVLTVLLGRRVARLVLLGLYRTSEAVPKALRPVKPPREPVPRATRPPPKKERVTAPNPRVAVETEPKLTPYPVPIDSRLCDAVRDLRKIGANEADAKRAAREAYDAMAAGADFTLDELLTRAIPLLFKKK